MSSFRIRPILITGAGYRAPEGWDGDPLADDLVKLNIGATSALVLAQHGFPVIIIGRRESIVARLHSSLKSRFPKLALAGAAIDITREADLAQFVSTLPIENGIDLVQSVGLSSGHYELKDDNPYALIEELNPATVVQELSIPVLGFLNTVRVLLPLWDGHRPARAIIVNSMSAMRAYRRGGSHATSKGALHQAIRSICLELYQRQVFLSEINPGIVDTGLYDRDVVKIAVKDIAESFGQQVGADQLPAMSPRAVADAVLFALTNPSHILQINMVASGQFPNLGA